MNKEREAELMFDAMRAILGPRRPFVVLFEGTDDEDRIVTSMHPDDTLKTLETAVGEMKAGRTRDVTAPRRRK